MAKPENVWIICVPRVEICKTKIRYDIIQGFRNLYDQAKDEKIKKKAQELIETEEDLKYRKKDASVWT